jgi:hypothetical protein
MIATMNPSRAHSLLVAILLAATATARAEDTARPAAPGPVFSDTGPDAAAYGTAEGYPLGTFETSSEMRHLVATHSRFDALKPARTVARAAAPWPFRRARHAIALLSMSESFSVFRRHNKTAAHPE